MKIRNPHAVYINCDGAMDYGSKNSGGIGFIVSFPDYVNLQDINEMRGQYIGGNIERIEYEALIQALKYAYDLWGREQDALRNVRQLILVTDRFALQDSERTGAYKIREWRRNNWTNFEGKPIKNHDLLDKLDKLRKKISDTFQLRVNIEYRPRKQNKGADKLAKAGKKSGLPNYSLAKKGEKIGRRRFTGAEIKYRQLKANDVLRVHVFRKDPVQDLWEVWCEIIKGKLIGQKLRIYADNELSGYLKRGNEFNILIKEVKTTFILIHPLV